MNSTVSRLPIRDAARHRRRRALSMALLAAAAVGATARAGPPFFTDDPQPVDYGHNEFYVFSPLDRSDGSESLQGPAIEYNRGVAHETQFHVVVPFAGYTAAGGGSVFGLGDAEIGVKYRFVDERGDAPQIGTFPMIEVPTGSAARGLGNGRAWYRLPLWIQKSWGPWTSYGGIGLDLNRAPGMRDAGFGGVLLQRDLSTHLTLGGEVFRQEAQSTSGRGYTLVNLGGFWNFTTDFSLLFSGGRSADGERHTVAYLGLYWTWGPSG
jgi:hypothetical protein